MENTAQRKLSYSSANSTKILFSVRQGAGTSTFMCVCECASPKWLKRRFSLSQRKLMASQESKSARKKQQPHYILCSRWSFVLWLGAESAINLNNGAAAPFRIWHALIKVEFPQDRADRSLQHWNKWSEALELSYATYAIVCRHKCTLIFHNCTCGVVHCMAAYDARHWNDKYHK